MNRVLELCQEIQNFLRDNDLAAFFDNPVFVTRLAYRPLHCICDIFGYHNSLNVSLQRSSFTIIEAAERINSLREKLRLWSNRAEKRSFVNFPQLVQILADSDTQDDLCSTLIVDLKSHLKSV